MKVTVVVPVYNASSYISRCIDSILSNNYKSYKLLLINDGSTDNTLDILKDYEKRYKNIQVIDQKNRGVSNTRNIAINLAKTKYIMFIDNDDYIKSDYISTYVKAIDNSDYDMVIGGYQRIDDNGKILDNRKIIDSSWGKFVVVSPWAKIYNRDFLVKNDIKFLDYGIGEDVYFYLQIMSKTDRVKVIDYQGYYWYYNNSSISNTSHVGLNDDLDILYLVKECRKKTSSNKLVSENILNYFYVRLILYYLLYSGRNACSKEFVMEYKRLKDYINKNICDFRKLILFHTPKNEVIKFKFILKVFVLLDIFNLIPLFAKIYCKGK